MEDGTCLSLKWRKDSGWLISLYKNKKRQVCQIKPSSFRCSRGDSSDDTTTTIIDMMTELSEEFASGAVQEADLYTHRDKLIDKFGLVDTGKAEVDSTTTPGEALGHDDKRGCDQLRVRVREKRPDAHNNREAARVPKKAKCESWTQACHQTQTRHDSDLIGGLWTAAEMAVPHSTSDSES